jgi:hypothetical protein
MGVAVTREILTELNRIAKRRERLVLLVAFGPPAIYLFGPLLFGRKVLIPGLSAPMDDLLTVIVGAWMFGVMFWPYRAVRRELGLCCPNCGHIFERTSFEVVVTTGRCGGCGQQIVSEGCNRDA